MSDRVAEIEQHIFTKYGVDMDDIQFDPGGDAGFFDSKYSSYNGDNWTEISKEDQPLIDEWEALTDDTLRRQSDEPPTFDDALGAVCDANNRQEEVRKLK